MHVDTSDLKALGASAHNKESYRTDQPYAEVLETFENPLTTFFHYRKIHIEVAEFTSLCPITGQPDFAKIIIDYVPDQKCIESKSLKLYMLGYRNFGSFHESIVARICHDLVKALDPHRLLVKGEFTPRGGIPFWPEVEWIKGNAFPELRRQAE